METINSGDPIDSNDRLETYAMKEGGDSEIEEKIEVTTNELSSQRTEKYEIVSKMGYLLGVQKKYFESNQLLISVYDELDENKHARIIRNLCIIRTNLFKKFRAINNELTFNLKNIDRIPEYLDPDIPKQLKSDGVDIVHANWKITQYQTYVCELIKQKISNCKSIFPIWIEWEYIKNLFIISKTSPFKIKEVGTEYQNNLNCFPFNVFLRWEHPVEIGNILANDRKFVSQFLYPLNGKRFEDISKLTDVSEATRIDIHKYITERESVVFMVDCENSDPYKIYALLQSLSNDAVKHIKK